MTQTKVSIIIPTYNRVNLLPRAINSVLSQTFKDFEMYGKLVERGIIAFHDIVHGLKECVGGVPNFWQERKDNFQNQEIVKDWQQEGYGIGIIIKS